MAQIWSVAVLSLAAIASAGSAPAGHEYQAPGPNDVRSPCPGLNTLANHGFLPRSGKGLTVPMVVEGLKQGVNVGADFATAGALLGLNAMPVQPATSFDIDALDMHNYPLEHDGSLSRADYYSGNDYSFNSKIWNSVISYFNGQQYTSIPVATNARYARIQNARANNPTFIYGARQLVLSYGETALYMSVMGDPVTAKAPVSYVKEFFQNERLPYEQGWSPSLLETNFGTLGVMIAELQLANPHALQDDLTIGEGTLRDVWELRDPLTGQLLNSTCARAGLC